jgi:hypothetical protein
MLVDVVILFGVWFWGYCAGQKSKLQVDDVPTFTDAPPKQ